MSNVIFSQIDSINKVYSLGRNHMSLSQNEMFYRAALMCQLIDELVDDFPRLADFSKIKDILEAKNSFEDEYKRICGGNDEYKV